jgi:hypothetical protein
VDNLIYALFGNSLKASDLMFSVWIIKWLGNWAGCANRLSSRNLLCCLDICLGRLGICGGTQVCVCVCVCVCVGCIGGHQSWMTERQREVVRGGTVAVIIARHVNTEIQCQWVLMVLVNCHEGWGRICTGLDEVRCLFVCLFVCLFRVISYLECSIKLEMGGLERN